jgi:mannose-6-phosphate isomerase-like protein (cupin superfamily)
MFTFTTYTKSEVKEMLDAANRTTRDIKPSKMTDAQKKLLEVSKYIYLLNGIVKEDIIKITNDVSFMEFAENEEVFAHKEKSDEIYFLLRGMLAVEIEKEGVFKQVAAIKPMQLFGEMAFVTKKPRSARIKSIDPKSTVIKFVIDDDAYDASTCFAFMKLFKNIATIVAEKLEVSNEALVQSS